MSTPDAPQANPDSSPDAAAAVEASPQTEQQASKPNWLQRFVFGARDSEEQESEQAKAEPESKPNTLTLTEEELERRVQSETDRRAAKAAADEAARARKDLRRTDPIAHAELEEEEEAQQEAARGFHGVLRQAVSTYDAHTVAPLLEALPEAERKAIMDAAPEGMEGRKVLVTKAIAAIKAQGARETEERLRKSPAFRKQILSEARGIEDQPDLVPAMAGAPSVKSDGNAALLGAFEAASNRRS